MGWRHGVRSTLAGQMIKFKPIVNLLISFIFITTIVTGQRLDVCSESNESECCETTQDSCPEGLKILPDGNKTDYCRKSTTATKDDNITTTLRNQQTATVVPVTTSNKTTDSDQKNSTTDDPSPPIQSNSSVKICVRHCPDGYISNENSSRCDLHQIETDEVENLVPIIGGTVGGIIVIVVVIVIAVCYCRRCRNNRTLDEKSKHTRRRPISELLHIKKKVKKDDDIGIIESGSSNSGSRALQPASYENIVTHNPSELASSAQNELDEKTRYHKDPTIIKDEEVKPDKADESLYLNQFKTKRQQLKSIGRSNTEEDEVQNLPNAPSLPKTDDGRPLLLMETHPNLQVKMSIKTSQPKKDLRKHAFPTTPEKSAYVTMHASQKDLSLDKESNEDPKENYENFRFEKAGKKRHNIAPVADNNPQEDYENVDAKIKKIKKPDSIDEEDAEDYENAPSKVTKKDYENAPPKVTKK